MEGHLFMSYVDETLARVKKQNPDQPEFNQAVYEVLESLRPVIEKNEDAYRRDALLERLTTPERAVLFRVPWVDEPRLPRPVQQRHRPLQGRSALPSQRYLKRHQVPGL